jgi:ethanolamine utilization protein EutN
MKTGIVVGKVWATKRLPELPSGALLQVRLDGKPSEEVIALDTLGCGEGERVLICQGEMVAHWFTQKNTVVDALVVGVVDGGSSA